MAFNSVTEFPRSLATQTCVQSSLKRADHRSPYFGLMKRFNLAPGCRPSISVTELPALLARPDVATVGADGG